MDRNRGILIAGNWKMNHGARATSDFAAAAKSGWGSLSDRARKALAVTAGPGKLDALVFPPFLSLETARREFTGIPVAVGAQNVHFEEKGAFTGEISGAMLKEIGVGTTLVGHSERRQYFGETDASAKKRAESHLNQGFTVVLCYGETRAEREASRTEAVLERQLRDGLPAEWNERLVLAYEPVWAIGTGLTATPEQAEDAHAFSRAFLVKKYGADNAAKTKILYGGSVTPENVRGLLAKPNVDGGLVGGASLKAESFLALVEGAGSFL
ncbi:MAG: triose-phosphate isomerase [Bdellovibrionales bacterium]|nr:triose-phosphate isomerase [Bdellovibrionales bacterium]